MSDLDTAIAIATKVHKSQRDKAGQPYILHPLRLMFSFDNETEMIVAVLHDVVEDSELTLNDLKASGFAAPVISAIDCLSRRSNESYQVFIDRVSANSLATKIKIADLKDNMNLTRLSTIATKDLARVEKYHAALQQLCSVIL